MTKKQVLDFKPARRLEEVDDEHSKQMPEREHRPRSCDDSTRQCDSLSRMGFSERTAGLRRSVMTLLSISCECLKCRNPKTRSTATIARLEFAPPTFVKLARCGKPFLAILEDASVNVGAWRAFLREPVIEAPHSAALFCLCDVFDFHRRVLLANMVVTVIRNSCVFGI